MYRFSLIMLLLTFFAFAGCGTEPGQEEQEEQPPEELPPVTELAVSWSEEGLSELEVHVLEEAGGVLFVGTDQGTFKTEYNATQKWTHCGLDIEKAALVDLVVFSGEEVLAAVKYDSVETQDPTLFKSSDGGGSWEAVHVNKPEVLNYFTVKYLERPNNNTQNVFAYVGRIVRSGDGGITWDIVYEDGGFSEFLYISKDHPHQIWTGGWTNIFSPYLARSTDGGDTWRMLNEEVFFNADANANAAVVSPGDEQTVLVGFGNFGNLIRKSTDGGQTWRTVVKDFFIQTMKNSVRSPGRVYASGIHREGYLYVLVSDDYGESWGVGVFEDGPQDVWVHDLAVVEIQGEEVIYFGTNQGVFRGVVE